MPRVDLPRHLISFFTWRLDLKTGKERRKIKAINTCSSLGTNWKVFRLVYERATSNKLDPKLIMSFLGTASTIIAVPSGLLIYRSLLNTTRVLGAAIFLSTARIYKLNSVRRYPRIPCQPRLQGFHDLVPPGPSPGFPTTQRRQVKSSSLKKRSLPAWASLRSSR